MTPAAHPRTFAGASVSMVSSLPSTEIHIMAPACGSVCTIANLRTDAASVTMATCLLIRTLPVLAAGGSFYIIALLLAVVIRIFLACFHPRIATAVPPGEIARTVRTDPASAPMVIPRVPHRARRAQEPSSLEEEAGPLGATALRAHWRCAQLAHYVTVPWTRAAVEFLDARNVVMGLATALIRSDPGMMRDWGVVMSLPPSNYVSTIQASVAIGVSMWRLVAGLSFSGTTRHYTGIRTNQATAVLAGMRSCVVL